MLAASQWHWIQTTLAAVDRRLDHCRRPLPGLVGRQPRPDRRPRAAARPAAEKVRRERSTCAATSTTSSFCAARIDYIVTGAGHSRRVQQEARRARCRRVCKLRFFYPFDDKFGESDGMFTFMTVLDAYRMNTTYVNADGDMVAQYTTFNKRYQQ
jgi:hypothetical protein